MPYVRTRGNQVAIVHGARHPDTRQVEQQILFVLYSLEEAHDALRDLEEGGSHALRHALEHAHPQLRFDWPRLRREIAARLDGLPATAEPTHARMAGALHEDLVRFGRRLALTTPLDSRAAAMTIEAERAALEVLATWIARRLDDLHDIPETPGWPPPFRWPLGPREHRVPDDLEELGQAAYEGCDDERATATFRLLVEAFPGYADGWNLLGLIALRAGRHEEAIAHFERTVEVGRRALPRRVARRDWWSRLETRPYMRGLRNLALTLQRAGRHADAIAVATRLQKECEDDLSAAAFLAAAYLCLGEWAAARKAAIHLRGVFPLESAVAAFAACELGMWEEAAVDFVHALTNRPRGTAILLELRHKRPSPELVMAIEDHDGGVDAWTNLRPYLVTMDPAVRRFARTIWEVTSDVRAELEALKQDVDPGEPAARRAAYDRKAWLCSLDYARHLGREALAASEAGKSMGSKARRRTAGRRKQP